MAIGHQGAKNEKKPNKRPTIGPLAVDLASQAAGLARLADGPFGAIGGSSVQGQAAGLSDPRLHTIQRQVLAARIGRLQGHRRLNG